MIWEMIKKQARTLYRNPQQLALLLGFPVLLIIILGVALGSFFSGDEIEMDAQVAFIVHGSPQEDIEQFQREVENLQIPTDEKQTIIALADEMNMIHTLKNDIFPTIKNTVQLTEITGEAKESVLNDNTYAAVIEFPSQFTLHHLRYVLLEQGETQTIQIYENRDREIGASIVTNVLDTYEEQLTLALFSIKEQIDPGQLIVSDTYGQREYTSETKKISSKEYYTIGMAVMFALYLAATITSFAFLEKQSHVFDRIIVSNVSRWKYFFGIFISGLIFAYIQLLLIFGAALIIFQVKWPILPFFIVTFFISMSTGALGALFTALVYRFNSETVLQLFSLLIVLLSFIGGSFYPIADSSEFFQQISNLTPNGAGMTTYLKILSGEHIAHISNHLLYMVGFTVVLLTIAVISFPKRGQQS